MVLQGTGAVTATVTPVTGGTATIVTTQPGRKRCDSNQGSTITVSSTGQVTTAPGQNFITLGGTRGKFRFGPDHFIPNVVVFLLCGSFVYKLILYCGFRRKAVCNITYKS